MVWSRIVKWQRKISYFSKIYILLASENVHIAAKTYFSKRFVHAQEKRLRWLQFRFLSEFCTSGLCCVWALNHNWSSDSSIFSVSLSLVSARWNKSSLRKTRIFWKIWNCRCDKEYDLERLEARVGTREEKKQANQAQAKQKMWLVMETESGMWASSN